MPYSDEITPKETEAEGQNLAVLAESLYVANLLILPLLAFLVLVFVFITRHHDAAPLAKSHLEQTVSASLIFGFLMILIFGLIFILNLEGMTDTTLWIIGVILFTIIHAAMVLFGVIGLAKAMAGKTWPYPVLGRTFLSRLLK